MGTVQWVFFRPEAEADWKAITPPLPDRPVVTATVTATDPEGLSASVSGDFLVVWENYPEVVRAASDGEVIELTFDWEVEDDPGPRAEQFTVNVANEDGTGETVVVSGVSVEGKVVTLELASALERGQRVTLDYAWSPGGLQRDGGGQSASSFSGQAVELNLPVPPAPASFAVTATPGELDLWATWDSVEGADSYKLRWRQSGGEFAAGNAITVTDTQATITVSGYGEWEARLQACNDDGCGPEVSQTVDVVVPAIWLNLASARSTEGQVRPRTFAASWDPVEGASSYTLSWRRAGEDPPAPAQPDVPVQQARSLSSDGGRGANGQDENRLNLPSGQTSAEFNVPDDRAYHAKLEARNDENEVIAQGDNRAKQGDDSTDTTPPRLESGTVDGDTMTLYFSEPMDPNYVGVQSVVTLHFEHGGLARFGTYPHKVEVSGNQVVLFGLGASSWGLDRARVGQDVQVYYQKSPSENSAERIRDLAGNQVWTPYGGEYAGGYYEYTETIWLTNLTQPPMLEAAKAHPHWLTLTFDETLDGNSVPAASAFTVTVNGSPVSLASVNPVVVSGDTVTLALASLLSSTDVVTVSYEKPSGSKLRGPDGDAVNFSGQSVTNLVGAVPSVSQLAITSTPASNGTYAPGETIRVAVTFTEAVEVTGTPRLKIKLAPHYGERWADYASGSGATTLEFAYTVAEPDRSTRGVAVLRDALDLNGGVIRSAGTQKDAHLWYEALGHDPDHMVDWHRSAPRVPWVTGVAITSDAGDDRTYTLGDSIQVTATFSEAVNVDITSGKPRLKIRIDAPAPWFDTDDAARWADYSGGSGTTELTFAYTVIEANSSTRGVAVLGNSLALNGGTIRSVVTPPTDAHLRYGGLGHDPNHRVDVRTPTLRGVSMAGTTVALAYDEALDVDSVPPASAFTVQRTPQGGSEETVSLSGTPAIAGGAVLLTLAEPVLETDTGVKVSYAKPASGSGNPLRDRAGNEAAGFTGRTVEATDTTPPRLVRGEIDGDLITLYFSEALDEDSIGERNYFRLNTQTHGCGYDNVSILFTLEPREVFVSGNMVVVVGMDEYLGTRNRVGWWGGNLRYHADITANRLRDLAGNPVSTPEPYGNYWRTRIIRLENVTVFPWPEWAMVDGKRLTMTFDGPMNGGSTPAASAFTVKVNGSAVSLAGANPVSVANPFGRKVILTLASAVAAGDTATVSYERPANGRRLQNVVCEDAESFTDLPATNGTGVAPTGVAITSDPGDDDTYGLGETIRVTLTFSEAVNVTGTPRLKIKMGPGSRGKLMRYESGSGTTELTFVRKVSEQAFRAQPDISTAGIAVLADSLELNGGAIRYASSGEPAYVEHSGLDHDVNHKVDWRLPAPGVPGVNGVAITSDAGHDRTYALGETIRVALTFSEAVDVTGTPRLKMKMDPDWGEKWAYYESGSGTSNLTFAYTVVTVNRAPQGIAVLEHSLDLNRGTIKVGGRTQTNAHLWYDGLEPRHQPPGEWRAWRPSRPGPHRSPAWPSLRCRQPAPPTPWGRPSGLTLTFSEAVDVDTT